MRDSRSIGQFFNSCQGTVVLRRESAPQPGGWEAANCLRAIGCPLEHFDAIGFAARRVEDFAVAYALESGAHQADSQHVAGRI